MDKLNKNFLKGNVLKAEELNEIVTKLNEFATCINDNDVETSKATIQSIKNKMLVIGDTAGTAYDGAAGAALEQTVRELAGGAGTMYSVYVRNNLNSLGFAAQYGEECVLDFTFVSQYRDNINEPYKPTGELGLCTIMIKNSKFADFTTVKQMEVSSNVSIKQHITEWLICQVKLFGGSATEEDYAALTEALTDILREELDIDSDRIYVTYEEIGFWGWNGGNL